MQVRRVIGLGVGEGGVKGRKEGEVDDEGKNGRWAGN
jgi:hypothetical protein